MIVGMPFLLEHDTVEDACVLCRKLQLDFVELNANFPACQTDRLRAEDLVRLKEKYGLEFTLHVEEECDPFAFQQRVREAWLESFRASLRLAKAVRMPIVNMHLTHGVYITLPEKKVYLYERYRQEYRASLKAFRALCEEELAGCPVRIGIENTNGFQSHEQEAVDYLLESSVFGLTMDIGHLHGAGEKDLPFYQRHEDRLIHMHGHDALGKRDHLALGEGEIDLQGRFGWAERCHARVVLETKTVQALRTSVERLPAWL